MAAGIDKERPAGFIDILQGDPDAAHEPVRNAVEVNGIAVGKLPCAHGEIDGLKRNRFALVEEPEYLENMRMNRQRFDVRLELPRILDAPMTLILGFEIADDSRSPL